MIRMGKSIRHIWVKKWGLRRSKLQEHARLKSVRFSNFFSEFCNAICIIFSDDSHIVQAQLNSLSHSVRTYDIAHKL